MTAPVLSVIMFTACSPKPAPKAWSKEYISNFHDSLNAAFKSMSNKNQRNKIIGCVIEKVKQALPKGFASVSRDSGYRIVLKYSNECTNGLKDVEGTIAWTEYNESYLRKAVLKDLADTAICDCYITKLKSNYPNGVPLSLTDSVRHSFIRDCRQGVERLRKLNNRN